MTFILLHRGLIVLVIELLLAMFAIYGGFLLQRRKNGKPIQHKAILLGVAITLIIAASFMFAVTAMKS